MYNGELIGAEESFTVNVTHAEVSSTDSFASGAGVLNVVSDQPTGFTVTSYDRFFNPFAAMPTVSSQPPFDFQMDVRLDDKVSLTEASTGLTYKT